MAATLLLVEQLPANGAEPARALATRIRGHAGQDDTQPGGAPPGGSNAAIMVKSPPPAGFRR